MLSATQSAAKRRRKNHHNHHQQQQQQQQSNSLETVIQAPGSGFSSDDGASEQNFRAQASSNASSLATCISFKKKRNSSMISPAKTLCSTSFATTISMECDGFDNDNDSDDHRIIRSSTNNGIITNDDTIDNRLYNSKDGFNENADEQKQSIDGSSSFTQQTSLQEDTVVSTGPLSLFSPTNISFYTPITLPLGAGARCSVVSSSPGQTPCRRSIHFADIGNTSDYDHSETVGRRSLSISDLPAEIIVHHIIPQLSLTDIFSLTTCSQLMYSLCRASLSYAHPLALCMCLPQPFYILSFGEWKRNVFHQSMVRREWLRTLSKRKRFIPPEWYDQFKLLLSCVVGQAIAHSTDTDLSNLASMLYRSFSIILGLHDRRRECNCSANGWHLSETPDICDNYTGGPLSDMTGTAGGNVGGNHSNIRWFLLAIGADKQLIRSNPQLLPCIIRSLLWIQKEKHNKRRLLSQVEQMFMSLPPLLVSLPPEHIRRFIKGLSDEARAMREKIAAQQTATATAAPEVPAAVINSGADDGTDNTNNRRRPSNNHHMDNRPVRLEHPPNIDNSEAAQQSRIDQRTQEEEHPQQQDLPTGVQNSRRFFEPIKLAVMVCTATATLYPHCFNAQTLATILRNTFNLLAWGIPHAEIKYQIFMLCLSILRDIDRSAAVAMVDSSLLPPAECASGNGGETGRLKLIALVDILQSWIPQMTWELARDTLIDIRDLFQVHLLKMSRQSTLRPLNNFFCLD